MRVSGGEVTQAGDIRDRPSRDFPGEGLFIVGLEGNGFANWYSPETKQRARKNVERWLSENARPR